MNIYDVGDKIRVSGDFTDEEDEDVNPTTLTFTFRDPSGNSTSYVYGIGDELVRDSTGHHHVDLSLDEWGTWYYKWKGTGTAEAVQEGSFSVRAPSIP